MIQTIIKYLEELMKIVYVISMHYLKITWFNHTLCLIIEIACTEYLHDM